MFRSYQMAFQNDFNIQEGMDSEASGIVSGLHGTMPELVPDIYSNRVLCTCKCKKHQTCLTNSTASRYLRQIPYNYAACSSRGKETK